MNKITQLLDSMDFSKLVPDLDTLLGKLQLTCDLVILLGPLLLLAFGLMCLFLSPKEANHKLGFRTYFGMGSVAAWQFMQRIAGLVFSGLGGALLIAMIIVCLTMGGKDISQVAQTALTCMFWQAILGALAYITLCVFAAFRYDKDGNLRAWSQPKN